MVQVAVPGSGGVAEGFEHRIEKNVEQDLIQHLRCKNGCLTTLLGNFATPVAWKQIRVARAESHRRLKDP